MWNIVAIGHLSLVLPAGADIVSIVKWLTAKTSKYNT